FYWRGVARTVDRGAPQRKPYGTAILVYHAVGADGQPPSRDILAARAVRERPRGAPPRRANGVTADEDKPAPLPNSDSQRQTIVITIDDAYRDNYDVAWPLLSQRKLAATLFVVTGRVGRANDWSKNDELVARPLVSWEQLERMVRSGNVTLGAHTRSHPRLTV